MTPTTPPTADQGLWDHSRLKSTRQQFLAVMRLASLSSLVGGHFMVMFGGVLRAA